MTTYNFDAFGNPLPAKAGTNGQPQTVFLHSDGIYDPMLTQYYLLARHHSPALGRFTSLDPHPGEVPAPARLQRFGYAGQAPVPAADPACPGACGD